MRWNNHLEIFGFRLYLLFIISWFLHLGRRFPAWGALRMDMVIIALLIMFCIVAYRRRRDEALRSYRLWNYLTYLLVFIVFTIPFVEWPGSVVKSGLENYIKAAVFFYFTVLLVNDEGKLKVMVLCFVLCQLFRVAEPLYLHVTEGYWGSQASMWGAGGMEMMNRLAGSRYDIINPNGLAYVIVFILPMLHFLSYSSWAYRLLYLGSAPFLLYALVLTGSRSGIVALFVVVLGVIAKARHKVVVIGVVLCLSVVAISRLDEDLSDRYKSIFSSETKNAATVQGRLEGIERDIRVALRKPIVGHGLGTSIEASYNITGTGLRSHNLYSEVMQEIGFVGLIIFLCYMISIAISIIRNKDSLSRSSSEGGFIVCLNQSILLQYVMNVVFSIFSYGLSSYSWYLLGGLAVCIGAVENLREQRYDLQGRVSLLRQQ